MTRYRGQQQADRQGSSRENVEGSNRRTAEGSSRENVEGSNRRTAEGNRKNAEGNDGDTKSRTDK